MHVMRCVEKGGLEAANEILSGRVEERYGGGMKM